MDNFKEAESSVKLSWIDFSNISQALQLLVSSSDIDIDNARCIAETHIKIMSAYGELSPHMKPLFEALTREYQAKYPL